MSSASYQWKSLRNGENMGMLMEPDELNYSAVIFPEMWCESSRLHHHPIFNVLFLHGQWLWSNPFLYYSSQNGLILVLESGIQTLLDTRFLWLLVVWVLSWQIYSHLFRLMEPDRSQTWTEFRGFPIKQMSLGMCVFVGLTAGVKYCQYIMFSELAF